MVKFFLYKWWVFFRAAFFKISLRGKVKFNGLPIVRGNIKWGKNITINSCFYSNLFGLFQRSVIYAYDGAEIIIGDNVGMSGVTVHSRTRIEIGAGTLVGGNVKIMDHDFHPVDFRYRNPDVWERVGTQPILIGEKCFIGGGAMIMKGVKMGAYCVVGAGAVVLAGEYPSGALLAGNPAKIVKIYSVNEGGCSSCDCSN